MKKGAGSLALFGGNPAFTRPLSIGQRNFVGWDRVEHALRGIFSRRYYTNHGPLVQELEERLAGFFGVRHVLCMTNATIGLMIAAKALGLTGKVLVPSFGFPGTVQSLTWAGLEPIFCDIDPVTHLITVASAEQGITPEVSAILGVHLWGNICHPGELARVADEKGLRLYFDAAHAFGCSCNGVPAGQFGDMEIFSFHMDNMLNSLEGGCISTNDDNLAEIIRNIRSSYGIRKSMTVSVTGNGRMSEAQAALALLSLEDFPRNRAANQERFELYQKRLSVIDGIRLVCPSSETQSNYQHVVAEIDEAAFGLSRTVLTSIIEAENVGSPLYPAGSIHHHEPYRTLYPGLQEAFHQTDKVSSRFLQLPTGKHVSGEDIQTLCDIITIAREQAGDIRALLKVKE
jgi:dTDP-4-amino-4,6-dideoxygalactose transaminase